jgi:hypothetical protein
MWFLNGLICRLPIIVAKSMRPISETQIRIPESRATPLKLLISRRSFMSVAHSRLRSLCHVACAISLFSLVVSAPVHAVAFVTEGGLLTGAQDVIVGTGRYDVTFVDGTCNGLFAGCSSNAFTFHTSSDAVDASQALLDQVFGGGGLYDLNPSLIRGCGELDWCDIFTPYAQANDNGSPSFLFAYAVNNADESNIEFVGELGVPSFINAIYDLAVLPFDTWALWSYVGEVEVSESDVPEPTSLSLVCVAALGMGWLQRRRRILTKSE